MTCEEQGVQGVGQCCRILPGLWDKLLRQGIMKTTFYVRGKSHLWGQSVLCDTFKL